MSCLDSSHDHVGILPTHRRIYRYHTWYPTILDPRTQTQLQQTAANQRLQFFILAFNQPEFIKMASLDRLTSLSNEIAKNTKILTEYLSSKDLEAPSFDVNGLTEFPISPNDEVPFKARLELIAATKELHDLTLGPKEGLRYLAWDVSQASEVEMSH